MENTSRHVFSIHGVTGMLIATVLLLAILGVFTFLGILAQQGVADQPYSLDLNKITAVSADNAQARVVEGK
jgi:cell division protein FtsB